MNSLPRRAERPARRSHAGGLLGDPAGRLAMVRAAVLIALILPAAALAYAWAAHHLGPRPITEAIHTTGRWTVRLLLLTLAVTPLRVVLGWPRLLQFRRMIGVTAACYGGAHLLLYGLDQNGDIAKIAGEIVARFYLTIGFAALLGLLVLAATSTNGWQRRLKRRWKQLHRLVYGLTLLALIHYFLQAKANVGEAVFAGGLFVWLMLWRLAPRRWQARLALLPALAVLAAGAAAIVEAAWYNLATTAHVPMARVLAANLDLAYGPRPAVQVGLVAAALCLLAGGVRLGQRRAAALRGSV